MPRQSHLQLPVLVGLALALAWPGTARADGGGDKGRFEGRAADLAKTLGKRSLDRFRRSITLGPFAGAAPGLTLDDPEADLRLSFGLALLRYDVPVLPSRDRLIEIIKSKAREQFIAELKRRATGGAPLTEEEKESIAQEVWEDVKAELLLEHRPKKLEKPSLGVLVEVDHQLSSGAWELGALVALGVGPVYVSAGPSLHWDDGLALYSALELSLPVLLSDGLRAPVAHIFLRADVASTDRDERTDRLFLGARFALDIL